MWVLTQTGDMVNLDHCVWIDIYCYDKYPEAEPIVEVVAYEPINRPVNDTDGSYERHILCTLEGADEEDGRGVIRRIFSAMMNGVIGIEMCDVMVDTQVIRR